MILRLWMRRCRHDIKNVNGRENGGNIGLAFSICGVEKSTPNSETPSPRTKGPFSPPTWKSLESILICRLKEENERLAAELHNHRMRMIAEQTLRKIDSNANTPTPTPPRTPTSPPRTPTSPPETSSFTSSTTNNTHYPHPLTPPLTPTTPRSPSSRIPVSPRMNGWSQLW